MDRWVPAAPPAAEPATAPDELPWVTRSDAPPPDADALERRAQDRLEASDLPGAVDALLDALALEPWRVSALTSLARIGSDAGRPRAGQLARSLLALMALEAPAPSPLAPPPPAELPGLLHDPTWAANRRLWGRLWEHGMPLFRESRPLPNLNDRVTRVATTPQARAFSAALDALGRDDLPAFYFDRSGEPRLELARTSPPAIIGGPELSSDEPGMAFALGQALELTRPEHLLVATLPRERAVAVIAAVLAAFGPADGSEEIERDAAALASELWRTIPARAQGEIRELLLATDRWTDDEGTRAAVFDAGARAGLIACGDLGVALRELGGLGSAASEQELADAVRSDAALARLARFAFTRLA